LANVCTSRITRCAITQYRSIIVGNMKDFIQGRMWHILYPALRGKYRIDDIKINSNVNIKYSNKEVNSSSKNRHNRDKSDAVNLFEFQWLYVECPFQDEFLILK
jgi:hypothetical protein